LFKLIQNTYFLNKMETSFDLDDKCLSLEGFETNVFHRNMKSLKEELDESLDKSDFDDESECPRTDKSSESNGFSKKFYILIILFIFISVSSIILFQIMRLNYLHIE
jgi:hypothetical protein